MKTRILHTKFWNDAFVSDLTPTEKLLFLYYLTNEQVNIIHCYECSDRKTTFDTGIDRGSILKAQEKFSQAGKIYFKDGYIFLKNSSKYEQYTGEKNEKARESLLRELSDEIRAWMDSPIDTPIARGSIETINHKSEIINHKGGSGGFPNVESLTDEVLQTISEEYRYSMEVLRGYVKKIKLYCESNGKSYKNYKATLLNWLDRDFEAGKVKKVTAQPKKIDQEVSPEQRVENLRKLAEVKAGLLANKII